MMGFFDKLKSVVNAVTGGSARVTIQLQQSCVFPGETVEVKITATSTGAEVQSKGAYVDVFAEERVSFRDDNTKEEISKAKTTTQQTIQIAPAFVLAPNETKTFEGSFHFPSEVLPTCALLIFIITKARNVEHKTHHLLNVVGDFTETTGVNVDDLVHGQRNTER